MSPNDIAEFVYHIAAAVAVIVGGGWVLYQYLIRRAGETGIGISVEAVVSAWSDAERLVFLDVLLRNIGNARLDASAASSSDLESEFGKSIGYSGSVQLRRVNKLQPVKIGHLDWRSESSGLSPLEGVPEVDLLKEYRDKQGRVEFFMEPGEEYHFGNAFILEPGTYLAKVVFVGKRPVEYWSRTVQVQVA